MDVDVALEGLPELGDRLGHAHDGILALDRDLAAQLTAAAPPMRAFESLRMGVRAWGTGDVWTLPAASWVAARDGRVHLPDGPDELAEHVQQLLDGH